MSNQKKRNLVTVVIPNWNGKEWLDPCLESLRSQTYKHFGIHVVDNGSDDGSIELLEGSYPEVVVHRLPENRGFAGAVNVGIRNAKTPLVALLNNDTEVEPNWLKELVATIESDPKAGLAASKMLFYSKRDHINTAGDGVSVYGVAFARGSHEPDGPAFAAQEEVFGASAGAAIYRTALFDDIGLFDERFFAYIEDVDISFRAQLAGYRCLFSPKSRVYHHMNATSRRLSGFGTYMTTRNLILMTIKDWPGRLLLKHLPKLLLGQVAWTLEGRSYERITQNLKAYIGVWRHIPYALRERHTIQRARRVTPDYIESLLLKEFPWPNRIIRTCKSLRLVKS